MPLIMIIINIIHATHYGPYMIYQRLLVALLCAQAIALSAQTTTIDQRIVLGKLLFNDRQLSEPAGQSCASCHRADVGHSDRGETVSPGADNTLFGNRNAPSIHYIKFNPALSWNQQDETWIGGFFLDGRALSLEEQTRGPLFNPLEMGNSSTVQLRNKIAEASYLPLFKQLYGENILSDSDAVVDAIADAISAYERGPEFALFSSKYDAYLRNEVALSPQEAEGLTLFEAEDKGNCAACHPSALGETGELPLFTDYSYDNLGAARNKKLPFLAMTAAYNPAGSDYRDLGLALNPHIPKAEQQKGKFKVPTLRNLTLTAPYLHNGLFEELREVVEFYNTRDVDDKWLTAEVAENVNKDELGDLGLTAAEIDALVAFLETLTDGYSPLVASRP